MVCLLFMVICAQVCFKGQNDGHQVDAQSCLWVSGGGVELRSAGGLSSISKAFFF